MLLLALVLYLYSVLGVWNFGANDPVHFDSVGVAMLTLFRCATLANWKEVYEINYWGCDRFPAERYEEAVRLEHFSANGFGRFPRWQCSRPEGNPVRAAAFFVTFSIIAAFVIISLFVGVITLGMFTALEEQRDRKASAICGVRHMPACPVGDAMCTHGWAAGEPNVSHFPFQAKLRKIARDRPFDGSNEGWDLAEKLKEQLDVALDEAEDDDPARRNAYIALCRLCARVRDSQTFNGVVLGCIVVSAFSIGVQAADNHNNGPNGPGAEEGRGVTDTIDLIVIVIFSVECVIRILAEGTLRAALPAKSLSEQHPHESHHHHHHDHHHHHGADGGATASAADGTGGGSGNGSGSGSSAQQTARAAAADEQRRRVGCCPEQRYFADNWNKFDFGILAVYYGVKLMDWVASGRTDYGNLTMFRLVRLLRVIKLMRVFTSLRILVEAVLEAFYRVLNVRLRLRTRMLAHMHIIFDSGYFLLGGQTPKIRTRMVARARAS